jgi:hypothetical protein
VASFRYDSQLMARGSKLKPNLSYLKPPQNNDRQTESDGHCTSRSIATLRLRNQNAHTLALQVDVLRHRIRVRVDDAQVLVVGRGDIDLTRWRTGRG